jgi:hypothetical protein
MESVGKGISWWLEEGMPRVLEWGHKEGWIGIEDQESYEEKTHK